MSKRKNRTTAPNLPRETLERARQQLVEERGEVPAKVEPAAETTPEPAPAAPAAARPTPRPGPAPVMTSSAKRVESRRRARAEVLQASGERQPEQLSHELIVERLEHPTRIVTEEELRQEYNYVLKDLRNMGVLAAALIVVLILIAQFL